MKWFESLQTIQSNPLLLTYLTQGVLHVDVDLGIPLPPTL